MVVFVAWLNAHAKLLAIGVGVSSAIGGGFVTVHGYVSGVDADIAAVEIEQEGVSDKLDAIRLDVSEVKCMTLAHVQGEDPLGCLYD
jgi:hypothetical protein